MGLETILKTQYIFQGWVIRTKESILVELWRLGGCAGQRGGRISRVDGRSAEVEVSKRRQQVVGIGGK